VLLDEINNKLEGVINEFRSRLPTADGLVVRPYMLRKSNRLRHQRAKTAQKYSSLPPYIRNVGRKG